MANPVTIGGVVLLAVGLACVYGYFRFRRWYVARVERLVASAAVAERDAEDAERIARAKQAGIEARDSVPTDPDEFWSGLSDESDSRR